MMIRGIRYPRECYYWQVLCNYCLVKGKRAEREGKEKEKERVGERQQDVML